MLQKDPKKIIDFAYNFRNFANTQNWIPRYDKDTDSLAIIPHKLSSDTRIRYIDDELAFYLRENGDIEGLFIEYFQNNFIKHHKNFKELEQAIKIKKQKSKKDESLLELSKANLKQVLSELEQVVQRAVVRD